MKYDPDYGTYEVHFPDPNGTWIEHIEFDDILKLLPKSWARQQAQQNHAAMVYYLDRACMEADNIAVNNVISQDFTEPKTYEEATKDEAGTWISITRRQMFEAHQICLWTCSGAKAIFPFVSRSLQKVQVDATQI